MSEQLEWDDDGYPTEEAERRVREFKGEVRDLLQIVRTGWHLPEWGWHEEDACDEDSLDRPVHRYQISTAGWSGNESLIAAMKANRIFWMMGWVQSRRGGHYIFEVPAEPTPESAPELQKEKM